jgi:hypothetical protein
MGVTKHNIRDVIESYLKNNRLKYTIDNEDSKGLFYEIFVGSLECYLQIEYDLDDDNDVYVVIQLFTKVDDYGMSLYRQDWDNKTDGADSLEGEIETLIQETKRLNGVINKIRNKIEQIKEICEENDMEFDEFITLNYDFD